MFFSAQIPSADAIDAVGRLELTVIAIVAMCITVYLLARLVSKAQSTSEKAVDALNKNTEVLQGISARDATYRERSLQEKEKTREWISTTGNSVIDMTKALAEMQRSLGMAIEGNTDAIRGKDGVLEVLHTSALQLTGLANKTQSVVDAAQQIIASLEQVKNAMSTSDLEMKLKIESVQNLLSTIASNVQAIPAAVVSAETNIIAAINKQPPAPSPPPITDETIASKPQTENGKSNKGRETEHVEPSTD